MNNSAEETARAAIQAAPHDTGLYLALAECLEQGNDWRHQFLRIQWTMTRNIWSRILTLIHPENFSNDIDHQHLHVNRQTFIQETSNIFGRVATMVRATMNLDALEKIPRAYHVLNLQNKRHVFHPYHFAVDSDTHRTLNALARDCQIVSSQIYTLLNTQYYQINHELGYSPDAYPDDLPTRARNVLQSIGIDTVWQLQGCTLIELQSVHACGQKTVNDIEAFMQKHRLTFSQELEGVEP